VLPLPWTATIFPQPHRSVIALLFARIHFGITRRKHHIRPGGPAEFQVTLQIARVLGEIFGGGELGGIDINAHDHLAGGADVPPGFPHETEMPVMQIPHGWHQADTEVLVLPAPGKLLHGAGTGNDSHGPILTEAGLILRMKRPRGKIPARLVRFQC
jgi:hypothetical protein